MLYILTLAYPLLYLVPLIRETGHFVENLYFAVIFLILIAKLPSQRTIAISNLSISLFFVIIFFTFSSIHETVGRSLLLMLLFTACLISSFDSGQIKKRDILLVSLFYITISIILLGSEWAYIDDGLRYRGFSLSPTHYSVYMVLAWAMTMLLRIPVAVKFAISCSMIFFIFISETRLSYFLVLIILIVCVLHQAGIFAHRIFRTIFFTTYAVTIALAYPLYAMVSKLGIFGLSRYDEVDLSYEARAQFSNELLSSVSEGSWWNIIAGAGDGASRAEIITSFGYDYLPHNDFLLLLYDYGVLGLLTVMGTIIFLATRNTSTLVVGIVYITSFYHNMLYSYAFIILLMIFGRQDITRLPSSDASKSP